MLILSTTNLEVTLYKKIIESIKQLTTLILKNTQKKKKLRQFQQFLEILRGMIYGLNVI